MNSLINISFFKSNENKKRFKEQNNTNKTQ